MLVCEVDHRVTMARQLIWLLTAFFVSLAGADVCFRKYNAVRDGCRGQIHGHTSLDADTCCSDGGQGHAIQLLKQPSTNGKKWFSCSACPTSKNSEIAKTHSSRSITIDKPSSTETGSSHDIKYIDEEVDGKLLSFQTNGLSDQVHSDDIASSSKTTANFEIPNDLLGGATRQRTSELKTHRSATGYRQRQKTTIDHKLSSTSLLSVNETSDSAWSDWSDWNPCSATCGDHGKVQRTRFCLTGNCRDGADFEEKLCTDTQPCPVDGDWSQWSEWSSCNVSCRSTPGDADESTLIASKRRSRTCDNPAPKYGGSDCIGSLEEVSECDELPLCPVDGGWSMWTNWTTCTTSCGEGLQTRSRQCDNPLPRFGGRPCEGLELESAPCIMRSNCPVDGQWSEWSRMETCSAKPCSGQRGFRIRFRSCTNPAPSASGVPCRGRSWIREQCYNNDFCTDKVDGGWCSWSEWSECNNDVRLKTRQRTCTCPPPANGGIDCQGETVETKTCATIIPTPISKTETHVRAKGCQAEGSGDDGANVECDTEQENSANNDDQDDDGDDGSASE